MTYKHWYLVQYKNKGGWVTEAVIKSYFAAGRMRELFQESRPDLIWRLAPSVEELDDGGTRDNED